MTYRFDHLRTLSPKLAEIAESFPGPVEGDSRTTFVDRIQIEELEILATEVGVPGNVFVDFGVYDYRQPNEISYDPEWLAQDDTNEPQAMHAVCWFDLLPQEDASIVKSLPGSGIEGSTSDYC